MPNKGLVKILTQSKISALGGIHIIQSLLLFLFFLFNRELKIDFI